MLIPCLTLGQPLFCPASAHSVYSVYSVYSVVHSLPSLFRLATRQHQYRLTPGAALDLQQLA